MAYAEIEDLRKEISFALPYSQVGTIKTAQKKRTNI